MARRIHLQPYLSIDELEHRYRTAKEPNERTWWQILWLLAQGRTATELSAVIGYRADWIGQIAKRYNEQGPEHVHLLFLPPYSPELQPAEHLWPLTNSVLITRHFPAMDDLEEVRQRAAMIRSTTCVHWWPRHIHKRRGPRTR